MGILSQMCINIATSQREMKVNPIYFVLSLLSGAILPLQAALNAGLAARTTGPLFSTAINFTTGLIVLVIALFVMRVPLPTLSVASGVPWYYWTGGLLGMFFVISTMVAAPKLGAAFLIALVICGQITASLIFDHYGWLGYQVREINLGRLAGAGFLLVGVYLVYKY